MSRAIWIVYTERGQNGVLYLCERDWRALCPTDTAALLKWENNTHAFGGILPCDECKKRGRVSKK